MKIKIKVILLIFIFFLFLPLHNCAKRTEHFKLYRFIYQMKKKNVIKSPLKNLFQKFDKYGQEFTAEKSADLRLGIENNVSKYYESLAEIYGKYDLRIGKNPFHIKKKLKIGEYSINTLFAPPLSKFMFKLKVPKNSPKLDFGYGIFPALSEKRKGEVNFKIIVEDDKENSKVLFSRNIDSSEKNDREIVHDRIDLTSYSKKKIKLFFVTEDIFSKDKKKEVHPNNNYSFWYNPVIYSSPEEPKEMNVILISLDTLRADRLGCYGYYKDTSPSIDKFASEAVLFLNTFSQAPWTLPSHMSMLTSLNLINHQVYEHTDKLNDDVPTLADVLRWNDYFTTAFTGGVLVSSEYGFAKGFDMYYEDFPNDTPENLCQIAKDWMNRNKEKKFFLFLHTYQPHDPYSNENAYGKTFIDEESKWQKIDLLKLLREVQSAKPLKYRPMPEDEKENIIALYDGEIRYTDECLIKPLIDELKSLDLYERTMIIITSDHGEEFYEHEKWVHGEHLYNELIHVPLIIKFPYSKHKGKRIENNTSSIDIVPTILEELNIDYSRLEFDGKSLIKMIKGKENDDRISFAAETRYYESSWCFPKISVLYGRYKLILTGKEALERADESAILKNRRKLEIYDVRKDPFERNNLLNREEVTARDLIQVLYKNYYKKGEKKELRTTQITIDKELKERLKALGYIR